MSQTGQKRDKIFPCMTPLWSCAKKKKCSDAMRDDAAAIPKTNRSEPDVF